MERPRQLFRDYGLTLALLLAAVLIYWTTTVPAIRLNRERDRTQIELYQQQQERRDEIERLDAKASALTDPIEIERAHREKFGDLGLPRNEVLIHVEEPPAASEPTAVPPAPSRPGG
jgi:hypothetical protein